MTVKPIKIQLIIFPIMTVILGCQTSISPVIDEKNEINISWENQLSVNIKQSKDLPLHTAIENNDIDKINSLLVSGTPLDTRNQFGATPLQLATVKGDLNLVKLLLKNGANPEGQNFSNQTSLHFAALNGFDKIAEELIKSGALVNAIDDEYWTPLDCALWRGRGIIYKKLTEKQKVIDLLIKYGGKRGEIHDH